MKISGQDVDEPLSTSPGDVEFEVIVCLINVSKENEDEAAFFSQLQRFTPLPFHHMVSSLPHHSLQTAIISFWLAFLDVFSHLIVHSPSQTQLSDWTKVLNILDGFLERYLSLYGQYWLLPVDSFPEPAAESSEPNDALDKSRLLSILAFTQSLLSKCVGKDAYQSCEVRKLCVLIA